MLVEKPELAPLIEQIGDIARTGSQGPTKIAREDTAIFAYMLLNYSLFERIYLLYSKKWIDEETWKQWHRYLGTIAKHPMFQQVHEISEGTFDPAFQRIVDEASKPKSSDGS